MTFTRQRGTVDIYGDDIKFFNKVELVLRHLSSLYNIQEIRTPIFESANLYTKAVGDTSDIVKKEFYNFKDKGDREIALRPEGTAGTIRAIVEEKMLLKSNYPTKLFYLGPMFRYERPQSGRQRQFHQYGIEIVGNISIYDEVDAIMLAKMILDTCKVKKIKLEINNIGSPATRKKWIEALQVYFKKYKNDLSKDSQERLQSNPLRILDDKEDAKKDFVKKAPKLEKFLSDSEKEYFEEIKKLLDLLEVEYEQNHNLVRGLDYYNGLVFEFISTSDKLKGQSTIIGGGKYDGLVELTGGPNVAGIGFGLGIERLVIALKEENPKFIEPTSIDVVFAPLSKKAANLATLLSSILRLKGLVIENNFTTFKLDKHFKFAEKQGAKWVIIIGDQEIDKNIVIAKNQVDKKEHKVKIQELEEFLSGK